MANKTVYPYGTGGSLPSSIGIINDLRTGGADKALAAEQGKVLNEKLYGTFAIVETKADADIYRVLAGQENPNGVRIRVILPVTVGMYVETSCTEGKGVAVSIYDTIAKCKIADTNYLETLSYGYEQSVTGTVHYAGYLCVSLAKSNDSSFSDADMATFISALVLDVYDIDEEGDIQKIQDQIDEIKTSENESELPGKDLFLGKLVQKTQTSDGLSDTNSAYRVSTQSKMVVPFVGATLTFVLPNGYGIGIRSGNQASNLSNNNYWYFNGDTFTFASNVRYFRMTFSRATSVSDSAITTEITVAEVENLIATGKIKIRCNETDGDIVTRNFDAEKYVKAAMRNFVSNQTDNYSLKKLPIFAHTSDTHGDAKRFKQMMEYCDYLGVDAALVSGDTTAYAITNDFMQYINDIADESTTPVFICMGNHDARALTTAQAQNENVMGYLITKNSSTTPLGETYPTYYYQDFSSKKIRLISLNIYEGSRGTLDGANLTKTQCDWFISVLASTPSDYGVLVMFHSQESLPIAPEGKTAFMQPLITTPTFQTGISGTPFAKIIDAFIGKTSLSLTYTSNGSEITTTADFTGVASGVEFIAYVNGHNHRDMVGYIQNTTHKQLNLGMCCGVSVYGTDYPYLANLSDLPRDAVGATQDCFNIYAIDRSAKTVRIAKVGSNISGYDLSERKYMSIPYAD